MLFNTRKRNQWGLTLNWALELIVSTYITVEGVITLK